MAIRIKRSSGDLAPASLAAGQLAYTEGATNGGTLYYGEIGGTVREIAGKKFVDKVNGIAANAIANVVEDLTPQLGGALDVNGKSIVSVSNGNITLAPNGTGSVIIDGVTVNGAGVSAPGLYLDGTQGLFTATADLGSQSGEIAFSASELMTFSSGKDVIFSSQAGLITMNATANGNIEIAPGGTGDVQLTADTVRVGDANSAATITTNGTGNLVLNTNAGTNSGSITINQGTNGAIAIAANGTGAVTVASPIFATVVNTANTSPVTGRHTVTSSATDTYPSFVAQKHRSDIAFTSMTDEPAVYGFSVRDSTNANRTFGRWIGRYAGGSTNPTFTLRGSADGFTTNLHYMSIGGGLGTFGSTSSDYILTANTGGALKLTANGNSTSGVITIASGADGTISLVPNGVGKLLLDDVYWPASDGSANQVLITNGAGQSSWVNANSLVADVNTTYSVSAETVTSGANLRLTGSDSTTDDVAIIGGTNVTVTRTDANTITISSTDTVGISNVVEDTTPQLGGSLDVNGQSIVSVSNGNITLAPNGTGKVVISGDLQVDGTTTTINATNLDVADKNITVAKGAANAAAANGAGLTVEGPLTPATILYDGTNDRWALNKQTSLSGILYPAVDGTAGQFIKTNGSGVLSFDTITQATGLELENVVEDTTPQLGGSLDVNGNSIVSVSNGNIAITPDGTGSIVLDGLNWPQVDGTANYVLKTDGAGQLGWVAQTAGVTTFTGLSDVPASYTGSGAYYVKVNSGATALEFSQDVDDGTF